VIWVAALLSCMLSLGRLFAADHADGTLEQLLLSAAPLGVIAAAKAFAHWLVAGLPLVLIAPLIALQYDLPALLYPVLALSLLLGTPVLSLIGANRSRSHGSGCAAAACFCRCWCCRCMSRC